MSAVFEYELYVVELSDGRWAAYCYDFRLANLFARTFISPSAMELSDGRWAAYCYDHPGLLSLGETKNVAMMKMFNRICDHQRPSDEKESLLEKQLLEKLETGYPAVEYDNEIELEIMRKVLGYKKRLLEDHKKETGNRS